MRFVRLLLPTVLVLNPTTGSCQSAPSDSLNLISAVRANYAAVARRDTSALRGALADDAFSPDGVAPLIVCERDASGRVVGYVQQSPDGSVTRARRMP